MAGAFETFVDKFIYQEGYKLTLEGLTNTALIAVFGLLIGFVLGSIIAIVKLIPVKNVFVTIVKKICDGYVAIFRGTPIVVQLLLLHYALFPAMGLNLGDIPEASIIPWCRRRCNTEYSQPQQGSLLQLPSLLFFRWYQR